jgi:suppressor of ftsI
MSVAWFADGAGPWKTHLMPSRLACRWLPVVSATILLVSAAACTGAEPEPGPAEGADRFQTGQPTASPREIASSDGVLGTTFAIAEAQVEVGGIEVVGKSYDGRLMGPTLRLAPGDTLRIEVQNELTDQFTNIHLHGLHVSPLGRSDNIFRHIHPGTTEEVVVDIPDDHEPGLFWYHSHAHGFSEEQVFAGMSGMIVIDGITDLLPSGLERVQQQVFALKDVQLDGDSIVTDDIDSNAPTNRMVNGLLRPTISIAPGEVQLWRFANIGADIFYELAVDGIDFMVVSQDGWPVTTTYEQERLILPPGKRFEVLVAFPEAGTFELRTLEYRQGDDVYPDEVLATIDVSGDPQQTVDVEAGTSVFPTQDLSQMPIAARRDVIFSEDEDTNAFFIDGKSFDPERIDVSPVLGTVEEWLVRNTSDEEHPFHIHVNDFQVLAVDGQSLPFRGRQDTVVLPSGGSALIRIPFEDFTGSFVFHCHILAHEDAGMMAVVDVVDGS